MIKMWFFAFGLLATIMAETHNVDVGRTGLSFSPSSLYNVGIGDVVNFHFYPSNHSVAESSFEKPCKPRGDGDDKPIYSGFVPVDEGVASQMWSMTINKTDTIWLYCSQGDHQHCRNGQSMVINPMNNTEQTLDAYMQAASNANVSSPDEIFGGSLISDDGGQSEQGQNARPPMILVASSTGNNTKKTGGTAPMRENLIWELGIWGFVAILFFLTL